MSLQGFSFRQRPSRAPRHFVIDCAPIPKHQTSSSLQVRERPKPCLPPGTSQGALHCVGDKTGQTGPGGEGTRVWVGVWFGLGSPPRRN